MRDPRQYPFLDGRIELGFVRVASTKWKLLGRYECSRDKPLTAEEFRALPAPVCSIAVSGS